MGVPFVSSLECNPLPVVQEIETMTIKITTKPQIGSQIADIMDEAVAFGAPDDWSFSNDGSVTFSAKSLAAMIRWAASEGAQGHVATNIATLMEKVLA